MKKIFLLLIIAIPLFAQIKESQNILYVLDGHINKSLATMFLNLHNNKVSADYYYSNQSAQSLAGEIYFNSRIILTNNDSEQVQGIFSNTNYFSGIANNKTFDLTLRKSPLSVITMSNYHFVTNISYTQTLDTTVFEFQAQSLKLSNPNKLIGIDKINNLFAQDSTNMFRNLKEELQLREEHDCHSKPCYSAYEFYLEYDIKYTDHHILSLVCTEYIYNGGAHGLTRVSPIVYQLSNGKVLNNTVNDLIKSIEDPQLISLLRKKLLSPEKIKDSYFDFDTIRLNNSYYITPSGIAFVYNQYEIAAYVFGQIIIEFTFEELKPFITNTSDFYYLFQ
ncbi:MAG: DUF3298 and DUF4163 domain-containing protein [Brevinema sp.]